MSVNNMHAEYNKNKIVTATPAELTLMLYEGAIKYCNIAIIAIEQNQVEKAHKNIMKTQRIIEEFQITLNHKYEVAKHFEDVYKYLLLRLVDANLNKDVNALEEILVHLRSMRDTWKAVMQKARETA